MGNVCKQPHLEQSRFKTLSGAAKHKCIGLCEPARRVRHWLRPLNRGVFEQGAEGAGVGRRHAVSCLQ